MSHAPLRIGFRANRLGQILGERVAQQLKPYLGATTVQLHPVDSSGERGLDLRVGWPGSPLEHALAKGTIDLAVQNAKDLAPEPESGVLLAAVTERLTPFDVLIARDETIMDELPEGAVICAHTPLRRAQLLRYRDDLKLVDFTGSLDERIRMLDTGEVDGLIVSAAAVEHLGFQDRVTEIFTTEVLLPAAGQGACVVQIRHGSKDLLKLVKHLETPTARMEIESERAFVRELKADASMAIGALAAIDGQNVRLDGLVTDRDGRRAVRDIEEGEAGDEVGIGSRLAQRLLVEGARRILSGVGTAAR
ncbi:MAG TPA: hydroxymethylbilane synthase [Candidatus Dormibacteraeota bacterium]|nr:hydroxymethylbilane synthase [Candidatus Dormibacteraeota bacterium]